MKLLLDTHVLLWALLEPQKLSPGLRDALEDSDNTLVVSAASAWEIATKWRLGKLQHARAVVENYAMALHRLAAIDLPISAAVARQAGLWEVPHRDPFDRLLAAQASADDLMLASTDPAFAQFAGIRIWDESPFQPSSHRRCRVQGLPSSSQKEPSTRRRC